MRPGPPKGYRWRGRRTRGEINSARPYLAAAPCWVSAEHAVLGKSPFLPLFVTPCPSDTRIRVSGGLLQVIPCSFSPCVFFEARREHPGPHGAVRGVPHRMDERCRDRATRSTPTRADSTQKASRETAITISLQRTALAARARTHWRHTYTERNTHTSAPLKLQNRNRRGFNSRNKAKIK